MWHRKLRVVFMLTEAPRRGRSGRPLPDRAERAADVVLTLRWCGAWRSRDSRSAWAPDVPSDPIPEESHSSELRRCRGGRRRGGGRCVAAAADGVKQKERWRLILSWFCHKLFVNECCGFGKKTLNALGFYTTWSSLLTSGGAQSVSDCPLIPLHVLVCVLSCNVFSVSVSLASFMPVVALQTDP